MKGGRNLQGRPRRREGGEGDPKLKGERQWFERNRNGIFAEKKHNKGGREETVMLNDNV